MANKDRLTLIQGAITRMAQNSFMLKGWTVAIVTAVLGFAAKDTDRSLAFLAVYVIVVFGLLDAYYLAIERSYRTLYATAADEADDAWGMTAGVTLVSVVQAVASPSVWLFYLASLVVALAVGFSG